MGLSTMPAAGFCRVLVANRGEIACRIIQGVQNAGYNAVALYSEVDADARHVRLADVAVPIGGRSPADSYLCIEKVVQAAKSAQCDAVHPGYGFLSESAEFALALKAESITFIGPSAEAMQLMGNKAVAKSRMLEAGVPCIRGYEGADQSNPALIREALAIGFPLMVKAAAGGGGRGMRRVDAEEALEEALQSARQEAQSAFGSDELILEQLVVDARHIEIQVAADHQGNVVHLGERDCSLQRRHQKVIEESPSPFVDATLRIAMGEAAVAAARACDYLGVGTVEFLVDQDGGFSFLEMNTRLQVEHPVTEWVTGIDLVDWQLRIAAGEKLPLNQDDITLTGHAIEARLYAEDPVQNFMPQTGQIHLWRPPRGPGVRVDYGIETGQVVSPYYDPMLAKIICWGPDRDEARRRLIRALEDTTLLGVPHNGHFLTQVLREPRFVAGNATTDLIDREGASAWLKSTAVGFEEAVLAAVLWRWQGLAWHPNRSRWIDWSNTEAFMHRERMEIDGNVFEIQVRPEEGGYLCQSASEGPVDSAAGDAEQVEHNPCCRVQALNWGVESVTVMLNGLQREIPFVFKGDTVYLKFRSQTHCIRRRTYQPALSEAQLGNGQIKANLEGLVIGVPVQVGERVERGQPLVLVEAMKMEHRMLADVDGVVQAVHVFEGTQISAGQLLVELNPEECK